jgi:hypothetical protein
VSLGLRSGTLWSALALAALATPARAQGTVYEYGTPEAGLAVYADTADGPPRVPQVGVEIISNNAGDPEVRAEFATAKVLAWADAPVGDSLTDGTASLKLIVENTCSVRLSETGHAGHEIRLPCIELLAFKHGMRVAAGQTPIYFSFQVEKEATVVRGSPTPTYPLDLRQAHINGDVIAQFVVDTNGKAIMGTFKEVKSTNPEFTDAVRTSVPLMRFVPATIGGHKVKQLVEMPFGFRVELQ